MTPTIQELNRRFDAIGTDVRNFELYRCIHSYATLILTDPDTSQMLLSDREAYYDFREEMVEFLMEHSGKQQNYHYGCDAKDCKNQATISKTEMEDSEEEALIWGKRNLEIERVNLWCLFILPRSVHVAIETMANRPANPANFWDIQLCKQMIEALSEISRGRVKKDNFLLLRVGQCLTELKAFHGIVIDRLTERQLNKARQENEVAQNIAANPVAKQAEVKPIPEFDRATSWTQVEMELFNDGDRVEIIIGKERVGEFHYADLGMNKGSATTCKPSVAWNMLKLMAMGNGEYRYSKGAETKAKNKLRKILKGLFANCSDEPLKCDAERKTYTCRFRIVDKADLRASYQDRITNSKPSGFLGDY
jgi:hypothetical protein